MQMGRLILCVGACRTSCVVCTAYICTCVRQLAFHMACVTRCRYYLKLYSQLRHVLLVGTTLAIGVNAQSQQDMTAMNI